MKFIISSLLTGIFVLIMIWILTIFDVKIFPGKIMSEQGLIKPSIISLKSVLIFENGILNKGYLMLGMLIILIFSAAIANYCSKILLKK